MTTNQTMRDLIEKAKCGDEPSFEALILSCKGKAYNIAYRYLKNEQDAMDALQESFIKVFRDISSFNFESQFETWVYRIVVNTCNDFLRKNKNITVISNFIQKNEEEYEIEIEDRRPGPEKLYEQKEEASYILKCLDKLPNEQKEIIILRDIRGFTYEEISEIIDCSLGTVKSRISRSRLKLKDIYMQGRE